MAEHSGHPHRILTIRWATSVHDAVGAGGHARGELWYLWSRLRALRESPREPGSEEYLNSEKYEIKHWDLDRPDSLKDFIARVNRIRRENPALHRDWGLHFHTVTNEQLLCYSKHSRGLIQTSSSSSSTSIPTIPSRAGSNCHRRPWMYLREGHYQVHDLLSDSRYLWHGPT